MSSSKQPPPMDPLDTSEAPPPSYTESLASPLSPQASSQSPTRVGEVVETYIVPHIYGDPTISLVIIPFNVPTLIPANTDSTPKKDGQPLSFPGETVVGFQSTDNPMVIRLSATYGPLEFWRRSAVKDDLKVQVGQKLNAMGYTVLPGSYRVKTGPREVEWKSPERGLLQEGEARVSAETKEVCLRTENEMGLYETKTGNALVIRIEVGTGGESDE